MRSTTQRAEIEALFQQLLPAHADHNANADVPHAARAPAGAALGQTHHVHASQRLLTVSSRRRHASVRQHLKTGVRRQHLWATCKEK